jgi:tRNA(Ile2) C34 agmatinyltransferase TiaS
MKAPSERKTIAQLTEVVLDIMKVTKESTCERTSHGIQVTVGLVDEDMRVYRIRALGHTVRVAMKDDDTEEHKYRMTYAALWDLLTAPGDVGRRLG